MPRGSEGSSALRAAAEERLRLPANMATIRRTISVAPPAIQRVADPSASGDPGAAGGGAGTTGMRLVLRDFERVPLDGVSLVGGPSSILGGRVLYSAR
jgi:hypothetical protein